MTAATIHRPESAFRFYLEETLDRFQHHLKYGSFPEDDDREEERLELYEMLTEEQRLDVWGLSADLYSLLDQEQPPADDVTLTKDELGKRLETAFSASNWKELLRLLRYEDGLMGRAVVDYTRYRAWSELGYPEVALAFIQNAVRLEPSDSAYKRLVLETQKRVKDWDSLARIADQYVSECPQDTGVLLSVGESYHDLAIRSRTSDYAEKAVEYLKRGLASIETSDVRDSQIVSAVVTLAFALLHLSRNDEAIGLLDSWIESNIANPELHAAKGIVTLTSNYDSAIREFEQAVKHGTKNILPYLEWSNWMLHEGLYEEAIKVAENGLAWAARSSDRAKLLHFMGIGFALSSQAGRAILLMTEAKQIDPTDQALAANLQRLKLAAKPDAVSASDLILPPTTTREADVLLRQLAA